MKFSQEQAPFKPIMITLETRQEAELLLSLIDKIDHAECHSGPAPKVTKDEYEIVRKISDAFTERKVII